MFEWALGILQQIETLIKAAAWVLGIGFIYAWRRGALEWQ